MIQPQRQLGLLMRLTWDFMKGMYTLHFVDPCVTVFGSARVKPGSRDYETARAIGFALGKMGITVMTGGGPGAMEAANRGAREAGGRSVGCKMRFPFEQTHNLYLDRVVTVRYFFVRKVMLFRHACAFVVLPGGLGTLDELFEALTLMQTGKVEAMPVILVGTSYWTPLVAVLREMMASGTVGPADLDHLLVTDDLDAVLLRVRTTVRSRIDPAASTVGASLPVSLQGERR